MLSPLEKALLARENSLQECAECSDAYGDALDDLEKENMSLQDQVSDLEDEVKGLKERITELEVALETAEVALEAVLTDTKSVPESGVGD